MEEFTPPRTTTEEEWQTIYRAEARQWQAAGMPPPQALSFDVFNMDVQIHTLMEVVIEMFDIDIEEWNYRYRCKKLEIFRNYRKEFIRAKIMRGVHGDNNSQPPPIV